MNNELTKKFKSFLENLTTKENSLLVDSVKKGFELCESLSTDDANAKKDGQAVGIYGAPASCTDIAQNKDNEYFEQTLDDETLEKVISSQAMGNRKRVHPDAGRGVVSMDPLKSGHGTQPNANFSTEGGLPGGSGGYNLGGP